MTDDFVPIGQVSQRVQRQLAEIVERSRTRARTDHGFPAGTCPHCGDTGRPVSNPTGYCRCERGELALQNDENRAAAERLWRQTEVPPRYQHARLADHDDPATTAAILTWVDRHPVTTGGANLILLGGVGTGKTWLGCAALRAIHEAGYRRLAFASTLDVLRASRYGDQGDPAAIARYKAATCLLLDDLGAEHDTAHTVAQLFDLVDARYREQRPTIVTTNLDLAGLRTYLGERIADRLTDDVTIVAVGGAPKP